MKRAKVLLVAAMSVLLAGCVLSGKPKPVAATPTPPQSVAPAPPPEPLSIPQTQVVLPAPQPVDPDALNTARPAEPAPQVQPKPPAAAPRTPSRPTNAGPVKPADTLPAAEPTEPVRAPIHEILPADEEKQLAASARDNQEKARRLLAGMKPRTAKQQRAVAEITQFLKQSIDAENAGDMRLADQLSQRALVLAKELEGGQ